MDKRICEHCGTAMHKIGPFASGKPEGEEAVSFDGTYQYQCINEECSAYQAIVEVKANGEVTYTEKMAELCGCDHVRGMHGHSFSIVPEGKPIPTRNVDSECSADGCDCSKFNPK